MPTVPSNAISLARYARQMIIPGVGREGQEKLRKASVLIVGLGGLGCPAALYLAGAGVGRLGLVDQDHVERSNLHRQVLHDESKLGLLKVESAKKGLLELNSEVQISCHPARLDNRNALDLVTSFDVILDCSDNAPTRYLLSDACVKASKPLVSASALRWEGQLSTFKDGPCYRCLHPKLPPTDTMTRCEEGGIMGTVTGIFGTMQAQEAIRLILGLQPAYQHHMLMMTQDGRMRTVLMRGRRTDCPCSNPQSIDLLNTDYGEGIPVCTQPSLNSMLQPHERVHVNELPVKAVLLDVRPKEQYEVGHVQQAISVPLDTLEDFLKEGRLALSKDVTIYAICRRGNASQKAVQILKQYGYDAKDVIGGTTEYARLIDSSILVS